MTSGQGHQGSNYQECWVQDTRKVFRTLITGEKINIPIILYPTCQIWSNFRITCHYASEKLNFEVIS